MKKHPIRRILLSTAATVSGVVLLLALKSPGMPGTSAQAGAPAAGVTAPAEPQQPAGGTAPSGPQQPGQQGQPQNPGPPNAGQQGEQPPSGGGQAARTVTGKAVKTDYGPVQVRITLAGGRITAADAVQAPSSNPRSQQITSSAVPQLGKETMAAQSAEIDAVSGATYTSEGYIGSLQSALDEAGV
ncbi:FMN-binding protein [Streptomyces sp. 8N706]|uniref:FMN-binding protein n=1 Tax=Streptomyces sp. 8N706 TaxID=3457416 RepID=UPI003FD326C3